MRTSTPRADAIRLRADWLVPVDRPPIADGSVVVAANRIVAVGASSDVGPGYPDVDVVDLGSVALTAGFVDSHCHVEWSLSPHAGPCTDGFAAWLTRIMERGAAMQPYDFLVAARVGVAQALLAGTTFMLDAGPTGAGAQAADELGMRAHVHLEAFGRLDGAEATQHAAAFSPRVAALDGELVRGGVSPHAPYTVSPALWQALATHPDLGGRPWMTHVAESDQELRAISGADGPLTDLFRTRGSSPGSWPGSGSVVSRLASAGALSPGLVAAHCVHLADDDLQTLRAAGVGIAHCPVSNADLGVGAHDLRASRSAEVPVGLGSDSPATAGRYDVRQVARATSERDPHQRLHLATLGGAAVAGRAHEIGSVTPGYLADLVAIAIAPGTREPVEALLDQGARVAMTMVDGLIVARDGVLAAGDHGAIIAAGAAVRTRIGG